MTQTGCSTAKALRLFKFLNVACISKTTFYRHAGCYIQPLVIKEWRDQQKDLLDKMAKSKDGVILTGDGRCDSPGYSAKFGSYTVIEQQINRVLDFQLVQVSEGMLPFNWISARK